MHLFNIAIEISKFNDYLNREIVIKLRNKDILNGKIVKVLKIEEVEPNKADDSKYRKVYESPSVILFQFQDDIPKEIEINTKEILYFEFIY